ncbi:MULTISPECIES: Cys-tRNA(Pro) deacylase [unclassified Granulicatella]|uniref:Cys-tRNA(Pro) deacylase n=1 Tax=unclassified Granulicatella TaxID=2630493 RepID=UPI00176E69CA|nr:MULTISPECIES: Cys-tRNA(Pro) deacylase [unclassified Granulicatella]MBS4750593.1 Cys-tRNA(Pro) deacylase [Carnobacteriaceae bacterium zg-ZUI78]QMI85349.1 Cys-tRNA(Pro) deacylase [Carnobacteriaceae bacterium zg-84]
MSKKLLKTNALRQLDQKKIAYTVHTYEWDEQHIGGRHILEQFKDKSERIYKTIVLVGKSGALYVCVVPITSELDLKQVAHVCKEKSVTLLPLDMLEKQTGYIRGGCSPVGMKKQLPTFFDTSVQNYDTIVVSAGKRGYQMELTPADLMNVTNGILSHLIQ